MKASIAADKKIWCGEMRIPIDKIDKRKPQAGQELRINFYRFQGPPPTANASRGSRPTATITMCPKPSAFCEWKSEAAEMRIAGLRI